MMTPETSDLWKSLSRTLFSNIDDVFIATFRRPGGANSRLATWDPFDKTMRYFKFMLYTAAERQPDRFFALYRALGRVDIGQPVSVKVRSCEINIDYLFALEEFFFLESTIKLDTVKTIVEIGAGFGRTCHTLLALADGIERYTIVDLPDVLKLSRRILAEAIPDHVHKVHFVDAADTNVWQNVAADLAINIDSFQEMPPTTIDAFMNGLVTQCRHFYVKNPVAKYDPKCIGLVIEDSSKFKDVFSLGYCRDIIDIFDDTALATARKAYLRAYRPTPSWRLLADRPMDMFPYLHHALFRSK
jgi:putative sugar O-methyltransferase